MFINIFLNQIFNKRIVIEYIIVLLIWIGLLVSSDASAISISSNSFTVIGIIITFIMTYYMASGLLSFNHARDYLSLPVSPLAYILNLSLAISIWLFATKYSYLIIIYLFISDPIPGVIYMLVVSLVAMYLSIWLIINFRKWQLAVLNICSILIMFLIEAKIESVSLKLIIYLIIVIGITLSYKKIKLNTISVTRLYTKISNLTINNYFLSILVSEQILLINSGINILVAVVFAISAPAYYLVLMPIPYALLALNSGISTMMSSELATREVIDSLPPNRMYWQYISFVYVYFLIANSLLVIAMTIVSPIYVLAYAIFLLIIPVVETITIVFMELKFPIKAWKVKPDLWRSYRKYIPPTVVLFVCLFIVSGIYL